MKKTGYIRKNIVKLIYTIPLVLPGIVYAIDSKELESLKIYAPHELNNITTPTGCARYDSSQIELGKSIDLESMTNLNLCGFKDAAIAEVPATGDMLFHRDTREARDPGNLFDKSVNYYDRFKKTLTKEYDQPAHEEVHMDLYDELYNQNNGGRRSIKWHLRF